MGTSSFLLIVHISAAVSSPSGKVMKLLFITFPVLLSTPLFRAEKILALPVRPLLYARFTKVWEKKCRLSYRKIILQCPLVGHGNGIEYIIKAQDTYPL